jgi:hypothetical protein
MRMSPTQWFQNVVGSPYFLTSSPLSTVYSYASAVRRFYTSGNAVMDYAPWDNALVSMGFLARNRMDEKQEALGSLQNVVAGVPQSPYLQALNPFSNSLQANILTSSYANNPWALSYMYFCNNGMEPQSVLFNAQANALGNIAGHVWGFSNGVQRFKTAYCTGSYVNSACVAQINGLGLLIPAQRCGTVVFSSAQGDSTNPSCSVSIQKSSPFLRSSDIPVE